MKYDVTTIEKQKISETFTKTTILRSIEIDDADGSKIERAEADFYKFVAARLAEKMKNEKLRLDKLDSIEFAEAWYCEGKEVCELGMTTWATTVAELVIRGEI